MVVNAIAPWEGKLTWVGTPNGGQSQNGEEWKSVEFVLTYTDSKLQERHIHLNAFGVDRVNKILSCPIGTQLRVTFQPTAREYNGKWYGKNEVFGITFPQPQVQTQAAQTAPQYTPQFGTQMPPQAPVYQQPAQFVQPTPVQPAPVQQPMSPAYRDLVSPDEDMPAF